MSFTLRPLKTIVCFGDSLTQMSSAAGGLVQRLSDTYIRKFDVVNRGHSGYNSSWLLPVVKNSLSTSEGSDLALVVIWLGANDSVVEGAVQHVPIPMFKQNLIAMRSLYPANVPTVFITAPPCQPEIWTERRTEITFAYGEAVKEIAEELGAGVVDTQAAFAGKDIPHLLSDGLHLSVAGYTVLYDAFMTILVKKYPHLDPEKVPEVLLPWNDVSMQSANGKLAAKIREEAGHAPR